jgi:Plavaka transposase
LPPPPPPPSQHQQIYYHPIIDGTPCDASGYDLPPGSLPPPHKEGADNNNYAPFKDQSDFQFADFLYREEQMSGRNLDTLFGLLAALYPDSEPPFASHDDLYCTIDSIPQGDIPWQSFCVSYNGKVPEGEPPSWMTTEYEVWFRDPLRVMEAQIGNPTFVNEFDFAPKQVFDKDGKRVYTDLLSGNWAWKQAVGVFLSFKQFDLIAAGHHCRRHRYTWRDVRTCNPGQR